jgi:hypothetical protein
MNYFSDQNHQAEVGPAPLEKQFSSSAWISFQRPVLVVARSRSRAPRSIAMALAMLEKALTETKSKAWQAADRQQIDNVQSGICRR